MEAKLSGRAWLTCSRPTLNKDTMPGRSFFPPYLLPLFPPVRCLPISSLLPPSPPSPYIPPREFHKSSAELAAELERAAPNMKALEQYGAVKEKEREQVRGGGRGGERQGGGSK